MMIVTIGVITRAHGVRGEVVVDVRTDTPDERFADGAVITTEPAHVGPLTVVRARPHGARLLVRFGEITDRATAENAGGTRLLVEIADDAETGDDDEYFDHQLIGLTAELPDGRRVGSITAVLHNTGQDLLEITQDDRGRALVPFVSEIVTRVDLDSGRVVVDPPDGLLDVGDAV